MQTGKVKNHFVTAETARRYAKSRPFHHPIVADLIRRFLKRTKPMRRALDGGEMHLHASTKRMPECDPALRAGSPSRN